MYTFHLMDDAGTATFWSKPIFDSVVGKCSPTSNLVVNSFSSKGSVTTLTTPSAVANLSTQLQAMLVGSTGKSELLFCNSADV